MTSPREKIMGEGSKMTSHFNDAMLFVQMKIYCHFYAKFLLLNVRIVRFESFIILTI